MALRDLHGPVPLVTCRHNRLHASFSRAVEPDPGSEKTGSQGLLEASGARWNGGVRGAEGYRPEKMKNAPAEISPKPITWFKPMGSLR
jgi:hypothetical protein